MIFKYYPKAQVSCSESIVQRLMEGIQKKLLLKSTVQELSFLQDGATFIGNDLIFNI